MAMGGAPHNGSGRATGRCVGPGRWREGGLRGSRGGRDGALREGGRAGRLRGHCRQRGARLPEVTPGGPAAPASPRPCFSCVPALKLGGWFRAAVEPLLPRGPSTLMKAITGVAAPSRVGARRVLAGGRSAGGLRPAASGAAGSPGEEQPLERSPGAVLGENAAQSCPKETRKLHLPPPCLARKSRQPGLRVLPGF